MNKYFFEIDRKFVNEGRGSPVDIEIFATAALMDRQKLSGDNLTERFDQLEELLRYYLKEIFIGLTLKMSLHWFTDDLEKHLRLL